MRGEIMVSICCLTYNHHKYIAKALDSFLMQKTTFPFEIIVHDDASTDDTPKIVKEYVEKYPEIIKLIGQETNQFSQGEVFGIYYRYIFPQVKGKYVAFCEGDDYWINDQKLQIQFEYMENHPNCSLAVHNVYRENESTGQRVLNHQNITTGEYQGERALSIFNSLPHTTSMFCRFEHFKNIEDYFFQASVPDYPMYFQFLTKGSIYYSESIMSVYRFLHSTSWTNNIRNSNANNQIHAIKMLYLFETFNVQTQGEFSVPLLKRIEQYRVAILMMEAYGFDEPVEQLYKRLDPNKMYTEQIRKLKSLADNLGFAPVVKNIKNAYLNGKKIFVYGAGRYGKMVYKTLNNNGINITGFLVTDGYKKREIDLNVPVYYRSELPCKSEKACILVALKPEYAKEVVSYCSQMHVWYPFRNLFMEGRRIAIWTN
ncbi:glycosyltransferase [Desulfobacter curvatus]|uniref:glycosyltransferase n=1 Tax=Desulfobacter curvatus TaxID=2290 RepID=UPI00036E3159|nr:glycosyltransferase [Desulfobacter curvatus]